MAVTPFNSMSKMSSRLEQDMVLVIASTVAVAMTHCRSMAMPGATSA